MSYSINNILQNQLLQWYRETGDHPRKIGLRKDLFNRLCVEAADGAMRRDENILTIVIQFKIPGPNGHVVIECEG